MVIGITGGSGVGKTTVCEWFKRHGFKVIDGDKISREVTLPCSPVLKKISDAFGKEYILPNGELDRRALGKKVFSYPEDLRKLNEIIHPAITEKVKEQLYNTENAVIDAAALHECDVYKLCDYSIFVSAPLNVRAKRIAKRDNISEEYAYLRINAQKSDQYYREKCKFEIINDGQKSTDEQLEALGLC